MRRALFLCVLVLGSVLAGPAFSAAAAPDPSVTLQAKPVLVAFGDPVRFSGKVSPPSAGQPVQIVDGKGEVLADATTRADGTYHASAAPERNVTVHAQWGTAESKPLNVRVQPRLTARRGEIKLFRQTVVQGKLTPPHGGSHIQVTLWRNGEPVQRTTPMLTRKGAFKTRLDIHGFGTLSVVVRFQDGDHAPVRWRSRPDRIAVPPSLGQGSTGDAVRLLERRLTQLHYRVPGVNGSFDYRDADAVMAFHKVQGMARTAYVDRDTWAALASPKEPKVRGPKKGMHFEVDLTKQVLYFVDDGVITAIMHVSTGKPSTPTRPGDFRVWTKQAGTNDHGMYYSSFFDGNRALHGYPEVPPYAASHGCVRIPFWNALWVYNRAPLGREVLVYF